MDTNVFRYPRVKSPKLDDQASSNGPDSDGLYNEEDTAPLEAAITPGPLSQSVDSNVPTLLTTGGRRSSRTSMTRSGSSGSSVSPSTKDHDYLGNVDALVNTSGSSPTLNGARRSGRKACRKAPYAAGGAIISQRSSDAAVAMDDEAGDSARKRLTWPALRPSAMCPSQYL